MPTLAKVSRGWKKVVLKVMKKYIAATLDLHFVTLKDGYNVFVPKKLVADREDICC